MLSSHIYSYGEQIPSYHMFMLNRRKVIRHRCTSVLIRTSETRVCIYEFVTRHWVNAKWNTRPAPYPMETWLFVRVMRETDHVSVYSSFRAISDLARCASSKPDRDFKYPLKAWDISRTCSKSSRSRQAFSSSSFSFCCAKRYSASATAVWNAVSYC